MDNVFTKLAAINCKPYVEKKGQFTYLSWTWAVHELRSADPTATWEVCRFNGLPFLSTEAGVFVEVAVTVQGVRLSQIHPVLNGANKPIAKPTSFEINTSIQRCLVKAIALHGLGLYIYAGEDLPREGAEEGAGDAEGDGEREGIPEKKLADLLAHLEESTTLEDLRDRTKNAYAIARAGADVDAHELIKAKSIEVAALPRFKEAA